MGTKSTEFRRMLFDPKILGLVSIGCVLEGVIAERLGVKALLLGGSGMAANVLGLPNAGMHTQTELVETVRRICDVTTVPLAVDCDSGFGNPTNVYRTVSGIIGAGAACLFVEDQVDPPRACTAPGVEVLPIEEAVENLRAAMAAKKDLGSDAVVMARSDSRMAVGGSLSDLITRLKAYESTGVDGTWVMGLKRDEVEVVRAEVRGAYYVSPLFMKPVPTLSELEAAGVSMTTLHIENVAHRAQWDFYSRLKEEGFDGGREYLLELGDHPLAKGAWPEWAEALGLGQLATGVGKP